VISADGSSGRTDPDDASATAKNQTTGTNASLNAVIVDFIGVQPVGADFGGDRSTATLADLTDPASFTTGASLTLDLTPFSGAGLPVELSWIAVK
jgi:hypothetical protein